MNAQIQETRMDNVQRHCRNWAQWVNSDYLSGLGYPTSTSEARTVYKRESDTQNKVDMSRWQAKAKNSRCAKVALPDWKNELIVDRIIHKLNPQFRMVIMCQHEVRMKHDQMQELGISARQMHLIGNDGRYTWPFQRLERIAVTGHSKSAFYRVLEWAYQDILANSDYYKIR